MLVRTTQRAPVARTRNSCSVQAAGPYRDFCCGRFDELAAKKMRRARDFLKESFAATLGLTVTTTSPSGIHSASAKGSKRRRGSKH